MKAVVDPKQCSLSGYCAQVMPRLFRLGGKHAEVLMDSIEGAELQEAAIEAESVCPTAAIRLEM
jgi:ferredoxin